jgi:hypothetical protein
MHRWRLIGLCEWLIEAVGWCLPVEGFAGPGVKFGGNRGQVGGGAYRQVGALGKILAQQPVRVLSRQSIPGVCLTEIFGLFLESNARGLRGKKKVVCR